MKYLIFPCVFGVTSFNGNKKTYCILTKSGKVLLKEQNYKIELKKFNLLLIRGILYFFYGFYCITSGFFEFNDFYSKQKNKALNKTEKSLNVSSTSIISFIIISVSIIVAVLLLGIFPLKLSYLIAPKNFNIFLRRFFVGLIKCIILYAVFLLVGLFPTFIQYYKFNSAIYDNDRCKQNYLLYLICTIFLTTFVVSLFGMTANRWYFFLINIIISLAVISLNYELLTIIIKNKHTRYIIYPFLFLIYKKPSQKEINCVKIIESELNFSSHKRDKIIMETNENLVPFSEAYVNAKQILQEANKLEQSDLDFIFCEVLNKNRAEIKLLKTISNLDYNKVLKAIKRRASGEPITKIFEHTNFYGLDFYVNKDVLSPRIDTERLVEVALKSITHKSYVLDLCTGSGAIAVAIAKNCRCKVMAVDISDNAIIVAKKNAEKNGVKIDIKKSDLFSNVGRTKFDVIVSNPPYIPSSDIKNLEEEVKKFDPLISLDGGETGLEFYEKIINEAPSKLNKNGKIFFEVGINQAKDVKKLLQKNFKDIRIVKDYNKIDRVVYATVNN